MSRTRRGVVWRAVLGAGLALGLLTACSGTEPFTLGEVVPLETDTSLEPTLTVTSVERVGDDEGLTDFGGGALTGDPWRVSYRIALGDGVRQDFTWDAIPDVSSGQWTARAGGSDVTASTLTGDAASLCNGTAAPPQEDSVVGDYCQIFVIPDGEAIDRVELADVGAWDVGE